MSETNLLQTPLHDWHVENGGRMVDFAGWQMPIQYASIIAEHEATRTRAALFDVSHMGRFDFSGTDVESFLDRIATRKISGMKPGGIRYSLVCQDDGGILDDILVYRLGTPSGDDQFSMVVNASNRDKLTKWFEQQMAGSDVSLTDRTTETAMIAVQGPRAIEIANGHLNVDLTSMKYFTGGHAEWESVPVTVSRTGYTGEDGCELVVPGSQAASVWRSLMAHDSVSAAGLGARDTLRLEAAMPLYGHELSETINPAQTDLGFALTLKDREFIGKPAIEAAMSDEQLPVRIGLELEGRRAAREGATLLAGGDTVGEVTSGCFSPTLQRSIAMGYVDRQLAKPGTSLMVDIRGKQVPAAVVQLPFYRRP